MAFQSFEQYVDTDISGLEVTINHNLGGYPFVSFLKVETSPDKQTLISVDNPDIVEVEVLNVNSIKVTFADVWTGYFRAILGVATSLAGTVDDQQQDINFIYEQLDKFTTTNQWRQMNALRDLQKSVLEEDIAALEADLATLKERVDNL